MNLETASGRVGSLIIPRGLSGNSDSLEVSFTRNTDAAADSSVGSIILSIELFDDSGAPITQLDEKLTICLAASSLPGIDRDAICLSYYDVVEERWICEDNNLVDTIEEGQLCGDTPHLTNFALLLSGDGSSAGWDNTMSWLTLGFTIGALVIIALSVMVLELHIRRQKRFQERHLRNLARLAQEPAAQL